MAKTARKINATTQKFTEIQDITEDIVLFSGGNACLVIEVVATNFSLLSAQEQDARIYAYAALLNSLSFPIQILIRSKKLDISSYLKLLEVEANKTQNKALATQIKLYKDFVAELVKVNTIIDKKFYIIIHYSYLEKGVTGAKSMVDKKNQSDFIAQAKAGLHSKAESIHSQLSRLSLRAKTLEKEELVKLFYDIYNDTLVETNQITDNIQTPIVEKGKI